MPMRELCVATFAIVALACATHAQAQGAARPTEADREGSRAGISISIATATTFRREAAQSGAAARFSISNARPVTAQGARAALATDWSAVRARLRRQIR